MERALQVALLARKFAVLARRPELLRVDARERVDAALTDSAPGPLSVLEAVLVCGAGKLDRVCAHAVRWLTYNADGANAVLDLLGVLPPDRVVAMYYALPPEAQAIAREDPAWAYYVQQVEAEMPEALARVEEVTHDAEPIPESPEEARVQDDLHDFRRDSLRSLLD